MPVTFARTLRSLERDQPRRTLWLVLCVVAAWSVWMLVAQIPVYETTQQARIEVSRAAFPLASLVDGRVVSASLNLGEEVESGQSLVQLDSTSSQLAMSESLAKVTALQNRSTAIDREISAERETLAALRAARKKGIEERQAQIVGAEVRLKLSTEDAEVSRRLNKAKAASDSELRKAEAKVAENKAALIESKAVMARTQLDRITEESECSTRIVRLEREAVELQGRVEIERAAIVRHEQAIKDRTIIAPVSGRLDEVGSLRVGSVVTAAQKLAVVVPRGEPRAVAYFPAIVVGRIQQGQPARLRLDGFPWTQYGTVSAEVSEVGTEPKDGLIRVELMLHPDSDSGVPIEHGLTGSVEIEVETSSPATLVLRAAGQFLGTKRTQTSEAAGA
jgi:multidrug resistance efflux pump